MDGSRERLRAGELGDKVQIGPCVTIVTDNHDRESFLYAAEQGLACEKITCGGGRGLPADDRRLRRRAHPHLGRDRRGSCLPPGGASGLHTGADLLIDGGTIAAIRTGEYTLGE